jgi:hypothetical protein
MDLGGQMKLEQWHLKIRPVQQVYLTTHNRQAPQQQFMERQFTTVRVHARLMGALEGGWLCNE